MVRWVTHELMRSVWLGWASGAFMKAAGCPWDVWGEIPAEKGMDSGFYRMLPLSLLWGEQENHEPCGNQASPFL